MSSGPRFDSSCLNRLFTSSIAKEGDFTASSTLKGDDDLPVSSKMLNGPIAITD